MVVMGRRQNTHVRLLSTTEADHGMSSAGVGITRDFQLLVAPI